MATINRCNTQVTAYSSGAMIYTLQPAAGSYNGTLRSNVSGDGTTWTVINNVEQYDINNDYDSSTTWTAPVDGIYFVNYVVYCEDLTTASFEGDLTFVTTSDSYIVNDWSIGEMATPAAHATFVGSIMIAMDATDTLIANMTISGSTLTVDVSEFTSLILTHMSVQLMG